MSRILFLGDAAGTGFGTVTRDLGSALIARGEDVRFLSLNELGGDLDEPFLGRTALLGDPTGWLAAEDPRTAGRLESMFVGGLFPDGWTPEAGIILGDPASLEMSPVLRFVPEGFPVFHYVPIEGVSLPPRWAAFWQRLTPVAMSEFGADQIATLGVPRPAVVYHGIDTDAFYPVSVARPIRIPTPDGIKTLRSREDCRAYIGVAPETVLLYRADRLMPRKAFGAMFRIVGPVLARNPNAALLLHCREQDEGGSVANWLSKLGPFAQRVAVTGAGGLADRRLLNIFYNAADIYVSTGAEGFGLTIGEAIACETPAVGLRYSSVPEVIGPAGVTVEVGALIDNIYGYFWATPNEQQFSAVLDELVRDVARRRLLGVKGPRHVADHFSWARAAEQFAALIHSRLEVAA